MILTYYQSVELMSFLPVLLSTVDAKTSTETVAMDTAANASEEANSGVYQMWNIATTGMEVNGAAFY